jgi:hypothetical protein
MKYAVALSLIFLAQSTLASSVRCTGTNKSGAKIGIDFALDPIERIEEISVFHLDSVSPLDVSQLSSPSHFLKTNSLGQLEFFGFKTWNDGLEQEIAVAYNAAQPAQAQLKLGYGKENVAVKNIRCGLTK